MSQLLLTAAQSTSAPSGLVYLLYGIIIVSVIVIVAVLISVLARRGRKDSRSAGGGTSGEKSAGGKSSGGDAGGGKTGGGRSGVRFGEGFGGGGPKTPDSVDGLKELDTAGGAGTVAPPSGKLKPIYQWNPGPRSLQVCKSCGVENAPERAVCSVCLRKLR